MKLEEIFSKITESLDPSTAFEFKQLRNGVWRIFTDVGNIDVVIDNKKINNSFIICHLKFDASGHQGRPELTNIFKNAGALRVFSSIIQIIRNVTPAPDIIIMKADDSQDETLSKKIRLYRTILNRLKASGMILTYEELNISGDIVQVAFPKSSKAIELSQSELEGLIVDFLSSFQ